LLLPLPENQGEPIGDKRKMTRFCPFIRVGVKKSENRERASHLFPDEIIHVHGFGGEDAGDKELEPGLQADVLCYG
jgi:hypothetical protein